MPTAKNPNDLACRRAKTLDLRLEGWTYDRIGQELGVSHTTVANDLKLALHQSLEHDLAAADEIRKLQNRRTEKVLHEVLSIMRRAESGGNLELALKAADRYLKAEERLAKSIGTDSPDRVEVAETELTPARIRELAKERFGKVTPDELTDTPDNDSPVDC
jgi:hypothetical protein